MKSKVLEFVNLIRAGKNMSILTSLNEECDLREDLNFNSFDLAELTVRIEDEFGIDIFEDGLVSKIGEIYVKLER